MTEDAIIKEIKDIEFKLNMLSEKYGLSYIFDTNGKYSLEKERAFTNVSIKVVKNLM